MDYKDYYGILGVEPEADADTIKRAYRKLARKYHPDVSDAADAEERFKEVGEAWEVLGDPEKRAAYDQLRSHGGAHSIDFEDLARAFGGGFGGGAGARGFGAGSAGTAGDGFSEFFRAMFGGGEGGFAFGGPGAAGFRTGGPGSEGFRRAGRGAAPEPPRATATLELSLEEAHRGVEKEVRLSLPDGSRQRRLKVRVPEGVTRGQQIRLRGQGPEGPDGRRGDLYVEIHVRPHPHFELAGRDVTLEVPLAPWEAVLGAEVEVSTLDGRVKVKVPPGTSGGRMRLRGKGLAGNPRGDHYLAFRVVVPDRPTERERALFAQLAEVSDFDPRA
jgi:curved DNA-binding protein